MKELDVQNALIINPSLIEEGLTFKEREVRLNGKRCDLLFIDKAGKQLYVEVKLKVSDRSVGQLIRYDGLVNNPDARFMLVGLDILDGLEEGLVKKGYEFKLLDETEIAKLISQLKHLTFQGKSSAGENDDNDWLNEVRSLVFRHTAKLKSIEMQQTYVEDRIDFLLE